MSRLSKVTKYTERCFYWGTVVCTAGFSLLILAGVVSRYVLRAPLLGSVELSRLLFIWACFLAAALCYRQRAHIAISFVVERCAPIWQQRLQRIVLVLSLAFFSILLVTSLQVTTALWVARLPVLGISQGWFYVPLPLVAIGMALFAGEQLADTYKMPEPC